MTEDQRFPPRIGYTTDGHDVTDEWNLLGRVRQLESALERLSNDTMQHVTDDYTEMVREFHEKFGHEIAPGVSLPRDEIMILRRKLIAEEYTELCKAIACDDIIKIADGLADLLYVLHGTALAYGIPIFDVFAEVHRSNMTKSGQVNADGKTLKGLDYSPPDIKGVLFRNEK